MKWFHTCENNKHFANQAWGFSIEVHYYTLQYLIHLLVFFLCLTEKSVPFVASQDPIFHFSFFFICRLFFFFLRGRCFCKDCLDILVGPGTFDKLKDVDPWSCYFCKPSLCDGNLKLRPDWSTKIQDFFVNNSAMEFVRTTLAPPSDAPHTRVHVTQHIPTSGPTRRITWNWRLRLIS